MISMTNSYRFIPQNELTLMNITVPNVFQCRQYVHVSKQFTARENPCKFVFAEKFKQKTFNNKFFITNCREFGMS